MGMGESFLPSLNWGGTEKSMLYIVVVYVQEFRGFIDQSSFKSQPTQHGWTIDPEQTEQTIVLYLDLYSILHRASLPLEN